MCTLTLRTMSSLQDISQHDLEVAGTVQANVRRAREIAAYSLPVLLENMVVNALTSNDPELQRKAAETAAKVSGALEDKSAASLPSISVSIGRRGLQLQITQPKASAQPEPEVIEAEPVDEPATWPFPRNPAPAALVVEANDGWGVDLLSLADD